MIPINTVPITAEELNSILKNPNCGIYTLVKNVFKMEDSDPDFDWIQHPPFCPNLVSKDKEYRISKDDYRHYFGEVVDLKEHTVGANTISYCGNNFQLVEHSGSFHLWNITNGGVEPVISNAKPECKQWLCDHFTALFKKDRPHDNIKFVWS